MQFNIHKLDNEKIINDFKKLDKASQEEIAIMLEVVKRTRLELTASYLNNMGLCALIIFFINTFYVQSSWFALGSALLGFLLFSFNYLKELYVLDVVMSEEILNIIYPDNVGKK